MSRTIQQFVDRQPALNRRRRMLYPAYSLLARIITRTEVHGQENLPKDGATLLMMNHISFIDPGIVTMASPDRYVVSMAKAEAIKNPVAWFMLRSWGNFMIRRGEVDREALDNAIQLLSSNQPVLIAPEGTRNKTGMGEAKSGTAYIAYKANATVVPVAICGADQWMDYLTKGRRVPVTLTFGKPFRFIIPEDKRFNRALREQMIQEAMYQLALTIPEEAAALRGVYSDIANATTDTLEFV